MNKNKQFKTIFKMQENKHLEKQKNILVNNSIAHHDPYMISSESLTSSSANNKSIGIIGLGNLGSLIVKHFLKAGIQVTVWNRSIEKTRQFENTIAVIVSSPIEVVNASDIIFSCIDPKFMVELIFGCHGILTYLTPDKGFVAMGIIDPNISIDIDTYIQDAGARYLEAMIDRGKVDTEGGSCVLFSAGNKSLFEDCQLSFSAITNHSMYLGSVVSTASKIKLSLTAIEGVMLSGLTEGVALGKRLGISSQQFFDVLVKTNICCPLFLQALKAIINNNFQSNHSLKRMQQNMSMAMNLSDVVTQSCPVTSVVNEEFKRFKRAGLGDLDISGVYLGTYML